MWWPISCLEILFGASIWFGHCFRNMVDYEDIISVLCRYVFHFLCKYWQCRVIASICTHYSIHALVSVSWRGYTVIDNACFWTVQGIQYTWRKPMGQVICRVNVWFVHTNRKTPHSGFKPGTFFFISYSSSMKLFCHNLLIYFFFDLWLQRARFWS